MTQSHNVTSRVVVAMLAIMVGLVCLPQIAAAYTITDINPEDGHMSGAIARNGVPIPNLQPNFIYGGPGEPDHRNVTDDYLGSVAYSGSTAGYGVVSQHIYSTSPVGGTVGHNITAVAYETTRMTFTQQETGLPHGYYTGEWREMTLNGFLSITKNPDSPDGYKGLSAKFELDTTRHYVDGGGHVPDTRFLGSVNLMGLSNGMPYVYTTGNIGYYTISSIVETEDTYTVYFDNVTYKYFVYGWVDTEFDVRIRYQSSLTTLGDGTGAEVKFGPDQPLPSEEVPEPATIALLGIGSGYGLLRRRRVV